MSVKFKIFRSSFKSWTKLCQQAAEFANSLASNELINISHSCSAADEGVVTVWYWSK